MEDGYQEQQLLQQQFPPPQVVEAPGATVTVRPPVAVVATWVEKLSMESAFLAEIFGHVVGCRTTSNYGSDQWLALVTRSSNWCSSSFRRRRWWKHQAPP